ncbi:MAG: ABC transporter ATP-binding protein [Oscillatoriaceae bacterium SKW80]|nr:ABC transporter ATP-binding protein [Oscillatoriaceae bacterium SKYG93]MCX8121428.1 ABC transporter ATP-binding protein [Oscillatoriaceae bacterium SKW80]MDW8451895.1 ABC transporter ATP-binding protein [Oscillatoriaceae cyanobacterium SKYGB_i_bin93]HIK29438.1 ABC transporter ATP-binding protein [Oscillatoriaceae cyanobacterium M7585_C2015_266]
MIEVEHLSKIYGATPAIQDVTFSVKKGEILGFLGPNGAGKTTTMRILSGYLPATSGTARIAGHEVHEESMAVRQRIGYLPENPPLYPEMTVEGFLYFVARLKRVPAGERARQVETALKRCNLLEKRDVLIRKLSKGFKQRVGIAQAIVHNPPVIILDEPTIGLDPRQIIEVRNLIKSLAGEHTIILSTHILPEVSMTCNRVAIINRGRIVATDTPEGLMNQLASGSGCELELESRPEEQTAVMEFLRELPGVSSVELIRAVNLPENRFRLRVLFPAGVESAPAIAFALAQRGINLYEMRRTRASLEDVFLQVTTEEKSAESEETTPASEEQGNTSELVEVNNNSSEKIKKDE